MDIVSPVWFKDSVNRVYPVIGGQVEINMQSLWNIAATSELRDEYVATAYKFSFPVPVDVLVQALKGSGVVSTLDSNTTPHPDAGKSFTALTGVSA